MRVFVKILLLLLVHSNGHAGRPDERCSALQVPQGAVELPRHWCFLRPGLVPDGLVQWAGLQQMFCCLASCLAWALVWLTNPELGVQVVVEAVVACTQPEDDDLFRSWQQVIWVLPVVVRVRLHPLLVLLGLDDGLGFFPSEKTPHLRRVIWIFADLIRKMSKLLSASAYFLRYFLFCAVFLDFYILADFLRSFMPEMMNVKNPHVRINAGNPVRVQKSVFFPHVRIFYALADFLRTCGIFTHLRIFYAHAYFPRTYGFSWCARLVKKILLLKMFLP